MNIVKTWKAWLCCAWLPLMFDSESSSKTENTTKNTDQRVALAAGGIGASASDGANVTINALDGGAINQAFGLGNHALDQVTGLATSELSGAHHTTELALSGALASVQDSKAAFNDALKAGLSTFKSANDQTAAAYNDAKIGDRQTMQTAVIVIGGALAAVVAVVAFRSANK